jgi:hypothetical protein
MEIQVVRALHFSIFACSIDLELFEAVTNTSTPGIRIGRSVSELDVLSSSIRTLTVLPMNALLKANTAIRFL